MTLTLEKYKGLGSRHTCPACGAKKVFVRYVDTETGRYLADHVGRCNRESNCGYHFKPKDYFAENPHLRNGNYENLLKPQIWTPAKPGIHPAMPSGRNGSQGSYENLAKPDYIDKGHLLATRNSTNAT
jgi:rubredoxin